MVKFVLRLQQTTINQTTKGKNSISGWPWLYMMLLALLRYPKPSFLLKPWVAETETLPAIGA